jgi:hypothetical protein
MASTGVSSAVSGGGRGGRNSPQLLLRPLARRSGFQCNLAPLLRPFVSGRAEGNPDLSFSFSRFCSLIWNNGRNKNAAGKSASPPYRGGVRRRERASARAATGADAPESGSMEAGRLITFLMTSESSSKKPVIRFVISRPFRFSLLPPRAIGEPLGVAASELIGRNLGQKKCSDGPEGRIWPMICLRVTYQLPLLRSSCFHVNGTYPQVSI